MATGGYLEWQQRFFTGPRYLMGAELGECPQSVSEDRPGSGIEIPMLAGGSVYQRSPAHLAAPLNLQPSEFELEFLGDREESYYAWRRAEAVAEVEPVEFWFARPLEDHWLIRDAATTWTLSRTLPFGLVPIATYPPRAWVRDRQGAASTELTLITTGTPAAGEFKVLPSANSFTIETADLSAEVGRLLVLRYHPLRLVRIDSLSDGTDTPNGLEYSVTLAEIVPARSYGAA